MYCLVHRAQYSTQMWIAVFQLCIDLINYSSFHMVFIHDVNETLPTSVHIFIDSVQQQQHRRADWLRLRANAFQQPYVYSQGEKPRYILNRSYPKSIGGSSAWVSWQRWRHARGGGKQSQSTQVKSRDQMCLLLHKRQPQVRDDSLTWAIISKWLYAKYDNNPRTNRIPNTCGCLLRHMCRLTFMAAMSFS